MSEGATAKHVMVIDESLVSRMIMRDIILIEYPDWEFIHAASIEKAFESCWELQFDYIFIDAVTSNVSDAEIISDILDGQKRVKVALMANQVPQHLQKKVEKHQLEIISKPVNSDDLINFIS
ncbi:hypothetical protein [Aliikangiella maris]|uniref:Uncharacterized protein n=2 Tax=Aliikangiella maris TaxID=3162458 RepID=A0ABV3MQT7_9GAMM